MLLLQSLVFGFLMSLLICYVNFLWKRRRLYYLASKIPGPQGLPWLGMAHKFINADFKTILTTLTSMSTGYPSISKIWLGPELLIFAADPESLQIVLNSQKCLDKSPLYDMLLLTKGLVLANGQMWKRHRKILNPAFNIGVLQSLIPLFDEKSRIFIDNLEKQVGKHRFDIYVYMSACSMETLLKGNFDIDRDIQSDPLTNGYLHHIECTARVLMSKVLNVFYHIKPIYRFTKSYRLEKKHFTDKIRKLADEVLEEKRNLKAVVSDEKETNHEDDGYRRKTKNYIKTLLNPENNFSEEEIKDEINTLVVAGHETSALVVSEALLMLAMHPLVQKLVTEELKEVYGSADTPIDYESLNRLSYLDLVVKETMRLFPVLPISARKTSDELQIGDYTVPANASIVVDTFTVQRSKQYWGEDADKFRPERFEPESFKKIHPYAFIPFTGGPRICIGWRYGTLFVKSVLANFLRKYEVDTTLKYEELSFELLISMKVVQKCMITLKKRDF